MRSFSFVMNTYLFDEVDLNSSVLSSTCSCVVGSDRLRLTVSDGSQPVSCDSFFDEEVPHRVRPLFRQFLVEFLATYTVSVTFNGEFGSWVLVQDLDDVYEY